MSLLTLAFPVLASNDLDRIQSWRKKNDQQFYKIVDPHFTIVFAVDGKPEEEFIKEIEERSKDIRKIEFEINRAIAHKDEFSELYHEFLIPGKGYTEIVSLHDKLYNGSLLPHLRADIEYIPHIGIGKSQDKVKCERDVEELNVNGLSISGSIESLTVVNYSNGVVNRIKEIILG